MKYILNKLPVKTTNGFKINDVEVDLDLVKYVHSKDYQIEGDLSSLVIQKSIKKEKITSKIGLEVKDYFDLEIKIPKNVQIKKPVFISYDFKNQDVLHSNIHFIYGENSSCDFILTMKSMDEGSHFNYLIEKVVSNKNSCGNITFLNLFNQNSNMFYALENDVLENASITHTIIDLGGKTRLYNVYSSLLEKNAVNHLNTIYIGKNDSLLDFNYYLKNVGKESNNQMKVEGVLGDTCHKNFRGTIDFIKGCCHSIGEENENCVLLSDTCRSRSLPQLLCGEEDVIGAHGVSSGKVSEEKLFYLMSKGYSKKEAERLLVLGKFDTILQQIPDLQTRDVVSSLIENIL